MATLKFVLDYALIGISIWMVMYIRGIGGMVGRTLNLITWGAVVTGLAHLIATYGGTFFDDLLGAGGGAVAHRAIVLGGFILLAMGFRQIEDLKS